jgi:hypothetical protein
MAELAFALYVSCVPAQGPTTRYGTRTFIGAERNAAQPTVIQYDPELVVALTAEEWRKYRREYQRALASGALVTRTAAEYRAQQAGALLAQAAAESVTAEATATAAAAASKPTDMGDATA